MCGEALVYFLGEKEYVVGRARPRNTKEIAVVTNSKYEIYKGDELFREGKCEIDGDAVRFLFHADEIGTFTAKVYADVGMETIINKTTLIVRE